MRLKKKNVETVKKLNKKKKKKKKKKNLETQQNGTIFS